jgi:hypothetical protein
MFSGLPQVADIVSSAFQYLADPPQLRIARSGPESLDRGVQPNSRPGNVLLNLMQRFVPVIRGAIIFRYLAAELGRVAVAS